jgi:hypothetical protein
MPSGTLTGFGVFGWDGEFQRMTVIDYPFAELLEATLVACGTIAKTSFRLTFLISSRSSVTATLSVFTAKVYPLYRFGLIFAKPSDA